MIEPKTHFQFGGKYRDVIHYMNALNGGCVCEYLALYEYGEPWRRRITWSWLIIMDQYGDRYEADDRESDDR